MTMKAQSGSERTVHFGASEAFCDQAERSFAIQSKRLVKLLPWARVEHIGATAVPGCITKGDLDVLVLVPRNKFMQSNQILEQHYLRNIGSDFSPTYSSFKDDESDPPLGIQLAEKNGLEAKSFQKLRDLLRSNPAYLKAYNDLKCAFNGKDMQEYRNEKSRFIERLLANN